MVHGKKDGVMQTIMIPDELLHKLEELCREKGYESIDTWLEEAVESQFASLRRKKAEEIAGRIRRGFHERGYTEEEILKDFETFRERLRDDVGPA